jgi:putative ABC transport system permease protein
MNLWNDLRYGFRTLRKAPGFSAATAITLALGIGATTAIFSVCDAMLWKPIPLPHLETLVAVEQADPNDPNDYSRTSPADLTDVRRDAASFSGLAWWNDGLANIVGSNGEAERVTQVLTSANFFDVVGVQPALGRAFHEREDEPGRERVAVLSDALWRRQFGGDASIVGKSIRFDDEQFLIIGVMPPNFEFPKTAQVWTPYALTPQERGLRSATMLDSVARLRPGVSLEQARAEVAAIGARLERDFPATNRNRKLTVFSEHEYLVGTLNHQYTMLLLYAALFVLLIACANVASLHFARASARTREVAVRVALGAGRSRLILQLLAESILIALAGAAMGLLIGSWGIELIRAGMPAEVAKYIVGWSTIGLDGRALGFTLLLSVTAGILAALVPALQFSRPNLNDALRSGSRGSAGREKLRLRSFLVAAQLCLAVVLLAGASLMTRGFQSMVDAALPLEPRTLLTLRLALTSRKYHEPYQRAAYYRDVLEKLAVLPGVKGVTAATAVPFSQHSSGRGFDIEGRQFEPGHTPAAMFQTTSASYFPTLHIPLLAGRFLDRTDGAGTPRVAVISDRMARRWWPNESPLGKRIRVHTLDNSDPWITIAGVVANVPQSTFDREPRAAVYVPFEQRPQLWMDIGIRTTGDPLLSAPAAIAAIRSIDPEQPVSDIASLDRLRHNESLGIIYVSSLMAVFGALALVLSSIGVYGVMAYLVTERTSEIGIRIALGAERSPVLSLIFRRGMITALAGLAVGIVLAYGLASLMRSLVWGVTAGDPATFIGIPLVLIAAAALAIFIPAHRATRIDPLVALRHE